jgi:hypothetical protein
MQFNDRQSICDSHFYVHFSGISEGRVLLVNYRTLPNQSIHLIHDKSAGRGSCWRTLNCMQTVCSLVMMNEYTCRAGLFLAGVCSIYFHVCIMLVCVWVNPIHFSHHEM